MRRVKDSEQMIYHLSIKSAALPNRLLYNTSVLIPIICIVVCDHSNTLPPRSSNLVLFVYF